MRSDRFVGAFSTALVMVYVGSCVAGAMKEAKAQAAETGAYLREPIPAATGAFEFTLATGYTQGFGQIGRSESLGEVAGAGIHVDPGVAYRFAPRWSAGATGQYQEFQSGHGAAARGILASAHVTYHVAPFVRADPWVLFGGGYRTLWDVIDGPANNVLSHGFEIAKVAIGFDIRATPDVAFAPVLGADLNLFMWRSIEDGANTAIRDPRLSTFVHAGLQGRFDIGGRHVSSGSQVARAQADEGHPAMSAPRR